MTLVTIEIVLKWFYFDQNNSGGFFIKNDLVDECVFIQAPSAADAIRIGSAFMDNSDSCACCGDRWGLDWVDDSDGTDEPMVYGEHINNVAKSLFRSTAILHHYNGVVEKYKFKEDLQS